MFRVFSIVLFLSCQKLTSIPFVNHGFRWSCRARPSFFTRLVRILIGLLRNRNSLFVCLFVWMYSRRSVNKLSSGYSRHEQWLAVFHDSETYLADVYMQRYMFSYDSNVILSVQTQSAGQALEHVIIIRQIQNIRIYQVRQFNTIPVFLLFISILSSGVVPTVGACDTTEILVCESVRDHDSYQTL